MDDCFTFDEIFQPREWHHRMHPAAASITLIRVWPFHYLIAVITTKSKCAILYIFITFFFSFLFFSLQVKKFLKTFINNSRLSTTFESYRVIENKPLSIQGYADLLHSFEA